MIQSPVQPNMGWGNICVSCKYVFTDDKKYVVFSPNFPCNAIRWRSAQDWFGPELVRYLDGSESCNEYKI